ncbi:Ribosomal biogenesis protein LAS1L [Bagarius yarrelli]|uniref:Ribosomal biogenesis protein LAS1L n=1 Tax=Bagarius yarrelli TaxID=175774 RepID=A0A556VWI5_BAGYA|nr:Ribosomal biogenesis protein LAS1L [Bagarius yarrelli]
MKKKRAEKCRHVVAWMNKAEWEQVVDYLHSREPAMQTHALHRISAWKGRILTDMNKPLPLDTQSNLLRLCTIYTQNHLGSCSPSNPDSSHSVYTLESLQEKVGVATQSPDQATESTKAPPTQEVQEQLNKVPWKQYPLGKVPGQLDDPSCLMVETYNTLTVFDQQVKGHHGNQSVPLQNRTGADGPLWTHNDISKLKAGLKLF